MYIVSTDVMLNMCLTFELSLEYENLRFNALRSMLPMNIVMRKEKQIDRERERVADKHMFFH
jgi:hypothetical protein